MAMENISLNEIEEKLETNRKTGLTSEEAKSRLAANGRNELPEKEKEPLYKTFFKQFVDPMIYILFAAILINVIFLILSLTGVMKDANVAEAVMEDVAEIVIIAVVILVNAIIGTIQERKAMKAINALKQMAAPHAFVLRDGVVSEIEAHDLVLGDVVILEEGNIVPADVRLTKAVNLKCDESSLTGESLPSEKNSDIVFSDNVIAADRINSAFMSSVVTYGRGEGIVIGTSLNTEIGKVATLLNEASEEKTPLQKKLAKLSKFLGILCVIIVVLMVIVDGVIRNSNWGNITLWFTDFAFSIKGAIALAVAAIPEGLVAVVTIVLALGMQRLAKVNTIVRKLPSVETLGAVSTICSDKTGTLTQNKMTVQGIYFNNQKIDLQNEYDPNIVRNLVRGFTLSSNARIDGNSSYGDPTEIALVALALKIGNTREEYENEYPRIDEIPFDSVRKMMSTLHQHGDETIMFTKGALDQILLRVTHIEVNGIVRKINDQDIASIEKASFEMTSNALRILALAYKKSNELTEENLVFLGFVGMIDPPRPEAFDAILKLRDAGITTIMITGDHIDTAYAIAHQLSIVEKHEDCYTGAQLDQMSAEELQEVVKTARVFARVSPTNKTDIVNALKANNQIVAMTGDGVNDAPSLKAADIGIAMGITGTDVAKGAADMVLTDDNFASIQKAVGEGRGIFANIKKTVIFLLSSNMAEVISMFLAVCIGLGSPLNPIHILWVNLVTDSLPAIALGMDNNDANLMKEKPQKADSSLFSGGGLFKMLFYGVLISLITLGVYVFSVLFSGGGFDLQSGAIIASTSGLKFGIESATELATIARTAAFSVLALSQLFHMFGMSSGKRSVFHNFSKKPKIMWFAFALGLVLQVAVCFIPGINTFFGTHNLFKVWPLWLIIFALSMLPLITHEIVALINRFERPKTK